MPRKFSYGTQQKRVYFTDKENEYIDYVSLKFTYCHLNRSSGSCLDIMFDKMEVFNIESEKIYKLFIEDFYIPEKKEDECDLFSF